MDNVCLYFFFFKQKTAYEMRISDWSSDVCSSDLEDQDALAPGHKGGGLGLAGARRAGFELLAAIARGDEPLGAPRHLGDIVVPEMFEECVEHLDRKSTRLNSSH